MALPKTPYAHPNLWGGASHLHGQLSPSLCKITSPGSRKTWDCKSGIQTFGIRGDCSPFKITMDLSFTHGIQKRWILVTLWRLLTSQFGDNPWQVPFAKHAIPFKWFAWLQGFFKIRSCQGLSPNYCSFCRHSKNGDYQALLLVWVFVHAIWIA